MKLDFRQRLLASTLLATAGLIANPFGDAMGELKKRVQNRAGRCLLPGRFVGPLDLARDLAFADDQAVQTGGHAKQVLDGGRIDAIVQMSAQLL